jgi:hypothetical protein
MKDYSFITSKEICLGQYPNREWAEMMARIEIASTGLAHRICLTTTYRDLTPRICWTVVLGEPGKGDKFQGKLI